MHTLPALPVSSSTACIDPTLGPIPATGIVVDSGNNVVVYTNTVVGTAIDTCRGGQRGIYATTTQHPSVWCNLVKDVGTGIELAYVSTTTAMYHNDFDHNHVGFKIGGHSPGALTRIPQHSQFRHGQPLEKLGFR